MKQGRLVLTLLQLFKGAQFPCAVYMCGKLQCDDGNSSQPQTLLCFNTTKMIFVEEETG